MKLHWLLPSLLSVFLLSSAAQAARLQSWRFDANQNRLYFTTEGGVQPQAQLIFNPTRLVIDLPGTTLEHPPVSQQSRGAIQAVRVGQFNPQTTRIVVELKPGYTLDPQQVQFRGISPSQWTVDIPTPTPLNAATAPSRGPEALSGGSIANSLRSPRPSPNAAAARQLPPLTARPAPGPVATIQSIDLTLEGTQLLVKADRPLAYTTDWNPSEAVYQVTIASAQLGSQVMPPQLDSRSPLRWVRMRQEGDQVLILVQPATGVQIGQVNQLSPQVLSLELQGGFRNFRRASMPPSPPSRVPIWRPRNNPSVPPAAPIPNGRLVVVIDPGHGGGDVGAVGIGGIQEKDIVLPLSQQVAQLLEKQGIQAVLTRSDDQEVELEPRVALASRVNATIFVSIHANSISMSRPEVNGIETYYYESGASLANVIHNSVVQATGARDRGVRQARFYVLRNTSMPAVLVEVGFVTGEEDGPRLADPGYRSQLATAIANGILQYLRQNRY